MRRHDREITNPNEILDILNACKVCRLGLVDAEGAYIVPMNFGYVAHLAAHGESHGNTPTAQPTYAPNRTRLPFALTLYMHSASVGRKISAMQNNARVCFEMDCAHALEGGAYMSDYTFHYQSIIGSGTVRFLTDADARMTAMVRLMQQQTAMPEAAIRAMPTEAQYMQNNVMAVLELTVEEFAAKRHG